MIAYNTTVKSVMPLTLIDRRWRHYVFGCSRLSPVLTPAYDVHSACENRLTCINLMNPEICQCSALLIP